MSRNLENHIVCPSCGGEGRKRHSDIIKMMHPLLWLDPVYQCKKCKKLFNVNATAPNFPQNTKKMNPILRWFLIFSIIFFVAWTILALILFAIS